MNHRVIELVLFRSRAGVSSEQMTAAALSVTPILEKLPGFVGRDFAATADGQYADIVRWIDIGSAKSAAEQVQQIPECGAFFALIDETTMTFLHLDVAGSGGGQ